MASYRVTHRTSYFYASEVTSSYGQLHLLPRDAPGQRCLSSEVDVVPAPSVLRERTDFFGNRVSYFWIHEPHLELTVATTSVVQVDERPHGLSLLTGESWEEARDSASDLDAIQFVLDSPLVVASDVYRIYAQESFTAGRSLIDAVSALCGQIHADFEYKPGSTSVATPLIEAFAKRQGVCQDFAHMGIACLRSLGLAARYVSGYLETDPPPGRPKLTGVDGSHAWLSVLVPGAGWLDVDPTNDQFTNDRYVVTAFGRDYGDVPPLNGVIYTEGKTESLKVAVDVVALS
jgi:transglutaminase-like putative cysteine protease